MLTEAQIVACCEKGYVVPDYRPSEKTLARIRADYDRLLAGHREFRDNCPALLNHNLGFLIYAREQTIVDMSQHSIFLLRGRDVSGRNDFRIRLNPN